MGSSVCLRETKERPAAEKHDSAVAAKKSSQKDKTKETGEGKMDKLDDRTKERDVRQKPNPGRSFCEHCECKALWDYAVLVMGHDLRTRTSGMGHAI